MISGGLQDSSGSTLGSNSRASRPKDSSKSLPALPGRPRGLPPAPELMPRSRGPCPRPSSGAGGRRPVHVPSCLPYSSAYGCVTAQPTVYRPPVGGLVLLNIKNLMLL